MAGEGSAPPRRGFEIDAILVHCSRVRIQHGQGRPDSLYFFVDWLDPDTRTYLGAEVYRFPDIRSLAERATEAPTFQLQGLLAHLESYNEGRLRRTTFVREPFILRRAADLPEEAARSALEYARQFHPSIAAWRRRNETRPQAVATIQQYGSSGDRGADQPATP